MTDFFVSYNSHDASWAEWIAFVLEEQKFKTVIQAWDFRPGSNFVLEMQKAAAEAERTVMVLSPDYLESIFTAPEWAAAFGQDSVGRERRLVPVMVRPCSPTGLLSSIVQIRIAGLEEDKARQTLLDGINQKRAKPTTRPAFPGSTAPAHKHFPGATKPQETQTRLGQMPVIRKGTSDADKRKSSRHGFSVIRELFASSLQQLSSQDDNVETDFRSATENDFRAEVFVGGKSKSRCRIWLGGMHSDNNIYFNSGRNVSDNSCNEVLSLSKHDGSLVFSALMSMGYSRAEKDIDARQMEPEQAAHYLWRRFTEPLER